MEKLKIGQKVWVKRYRDYREGKVVATKEAGTKIKVIVEYRKDVFSSTWYFRQDITTLEADAVSYQLKIKLRDIKYAKLRLTNTKKEITTLNREIANLTKKVARLNKGKR